MSMSSADAQVFTINQWTGATSSDWFVNSNWQADYVDGSNGGAYFSTIASTTEMTVNQSRSTGIWERYLIFSNPDPNSVTNYNLTGNKLLMKMGTISTAVFPTSVTSTADINDKPYIAIVNEGFGSVTIANDIIYDGGATNKGIVIRNNSTGLLSFTGKLGSDNRWTTPMVFDGSGKVSVADAMITNTSLANNGTGEVSITKFTSRGTSSYSGTSDITIDTLTLGYETWGSTFLHEGTGKITVQNITAPSTIPDQGSTLTVGKATATQSVLEVRNSFDFVGVVNVFEKDGTVGSCLILSAPDGTYAPSKGFSIRRAGIQQEGQNLGAIHFAADGTITSDVSLNYHGGIGVADGVTGVLAGNLIGADFNKQFTKYGAGTLVLKGAANTTGRDTGWIKVNQGTLRLDDGANVSAKNVYVESGAVLDLNGGTYTGTNADIQSGATLRVVNFADMPTDFSKFTPADNSRLSLGAGGAENWTAENLNSVLTNANFKYSALSSYALELDVAAGSSVSWSSPTNAKLALALGSGSTYNITANATNEESLYALSMTDATLNAGTNSIAVRELDASVPTVIKVDGSGTSTISASRVNFSLDNEAVVDIAPDATLSVGAELTYSDATGNPTNKSLTVTGGGTLAFADGFSTTSQLDVKVLTGTLDVSQLNRNTFADLLEWSLFQTPESDEPLTLGGALTMADQTILKAELTKNEAGDITAPVVYIDSEFDLDGATLQLDLMGNGTWTADDLNNVAIMDAGSLAHLTNRLESVILSDTLGQTWHLTDSGVLMYDGAEPPAPGVPEPSTWLLMVLGVVGLGWYRRRNRN